MEYLFLNRWFELRSQISKFDSDTDEIVSKYVRGIEHLVGWIFGASFFGASYYWMVSLKRIEPLAFWIGTLIWSQMQRSEAMDESPSATTGTVGWRTYPGTQIFHLLSSIRIICKKQKAKIWITEGEIDEILSRGYNNMELDVCRDVMRRLRYNFLGTLKPITQLIVDRW